MLCTFGVYFLFKNSFLFQYHENIFFILWNFSYKSVMVIYVCDVSICNLSWIHFCVWNEVEVIFCSLQMEFQLFQHFLFNAFLFLCNWLGIGQKSVGWIFMSDCKLFTDSFILDQCHTLLLGNYINLKNQVV